MMHLMIGEKTTLTGSDKRPINWCRLVHERTGVFVSVNPPQLNARLTRFMSWTRMKTLTANLNI